MFRAAIFIAICLAVTSPSPAQQVRVITGDIEHIYGPGGEVLDDADLRARNERAFERMQLDKQRAIEMRQIEAEKERLRFERDQAALAYATGPTLDSTYGTGLFTYRHRGHGRIGVAPKMGGSRRRQ
ncbi:hypothetical protein [Bradyrhizobium sp. 27S5]|uniref:hypothetical protein n=1 Tax=Bradyrhizobium sp. 27S5 TaxID=3139728 RepID=UPI0030D21642